MGHFVTSKDIPANGEHLDKGVAGKLKVVSLAVFVLGALASGYLLFVRNDQLHESFTYSWLFAFAFFLTLTLGGCFWVILHHVTNSGWGVAVRRLMENLGFVFPFMALMATPLMVPDVQEHLYEWMNEHRYAAKYDVAAEHLKKEVHEITADDMKEVKAKIKAGELDSPKSFASPSKDALYQSHNALLAAKKFYMNLPFWWGRIVAFFALLGAGIWFLRKKSIEQDTDPNPDCKRLILSRRASCIIMPIFAVSATFLAFDFLMALDFKWFSTMWGVYFFAGCAINSMAVLILTLTWLRGKGYLQTVASKEHYHIMGKLMHAFVIFWAYVSFSQFMLIWYAGITEETSYFLLRNTGVWNTVSICLVIFHFAVPFVFLLPHYVKKKTYLVVPVCIYLLFMHAVDLYHIVIPERGPSLSAMEKYGTLTGKADLSKPIELFASHPAYLGDILAFVTVGAFFVFVFLRNLTSASLFPNRDPRILESANLHN